MSRSAPASTICIVGDFHVVICGGGVAAIEGLLRLRNLAGDRVEITLVAPGDDFVYRPLAVREAVALGRARRYELSGIAKHTNAELVKDTLSWIDPPSRVAHTGAGRELRYDALLVAVGARQVADLKHATTFRDAEANRLYERVIEDVKDEHARSVAFVVPDGPVYPLPIYELALMTADAAARAAVSGLELCVVTPEPMPLATFGGSAGAVVSRVLTEAGIRIYASATAHTPGRRKLLIQPPGAELTPDRIVAMPRISGPGIRGLAGGSAHGFIPIDRHCAVPGTEGRVFAAGDATAFPVKHGGLSAQQADAAAAMIARLAGAGVDTPPFVPEIRGKLLTGGKPLYLKATVVGGHGFNSEVFDTPPWPVDDKIVAQELGPYLAGLDNR
jgi:sulfide:quinone oxidoreductase